MADKFIKKMKNFFINAVQRLIQRMTLDEGRGWGRRTGRFAIDSTVELKFLVEVFNIEEGDDSNGYERHNLGQHGLEKMSENRRGHRLKKNLKQLHPQSRLAELLPRHGKPH